MLSSVILKIERSYAIGIPIGRVRPASSFVDWGCFAKIWKFYPNSNLSTLSTNNKLVATFDIFSKVVAYLHPMVAILTNILPSDTCNIN